MIQGCSIRSCICNFFDGHGGYYVGSGGTNCSKIALVSEAELEKLSMTRSSGFHPSEKQHLVSIQNSSV